MAKKKPQVGANSRGADAPADAAAAAAAQQVQIIGGTDDAGIATAKPFDRAPLARPNTRFLNPLRILISIIPVILGLVLGYYNRQQQQQQQQHSTSSILSPSTKKSNSADHANNNNNKFIVAGFLPEYRLASRDVNDLCSKVTHLIFFSWEINEKTGALKDTNRFDSILEKLPRKKPCKYIVAIGGDGRSAGFGPMAKDSTKRETFVKDLKRFSDYVDGLELNWQYPSNMQDVENLGKLVEEIKLAIPRWQISMAIPPTRDFARVLRVVKLDKLVDYFHIMLYQNGIVSGAQTVNLAYDTVDSLTETLPEDKCTLGIAFYGQNSHTGGSASYEQVVQNPEEHSQTTIYSAQDIKALVHVAQSRGLAGVSIWELGQDCRKVAFGVHAATCGNRSPLLDTILTSQ